MLILPWTGFPKNHAIPEEHNIMIERNVAKSFQEAVNERIMNDIPKVLGSFLIMLLYVSLSLGKPDCFENRVNHCLIRAVIEYILPTCYDIIVLVNWAILFTFIGLSCLGRTCIYNIRLNYIIWIVQLLWFCCFTIAQLYSILIIRIGSRWYVCNCASARQF